jgi:hypothetical protein
MFFLLFLLVPAAAAMESPFPAKSPNLKGEIPQRADSFMAPS